MEDEKLKNLSNLLLEQASENKDIANVISAMIERLEKRELNLVLLGQFKRGKSTLANCLLGKEILPSGVVPLTSIITEIRFGKVEQIQVIFQNGKKTYLPLKMLSSFVTEKENPKNKKKVEKVMVFCKSDFLRDGIVLIDTPGISSTLSHNTEVTEKYIPNCDAAIFIISADSPLSSEEIDFIKRIGRYSTKIFFVLNKCDYSTDEEIKELINHIENELFRIGLKVKLIPLSSKLGLEAKKNKDKDLLEKSGLASFEKHLLDFLSSKKNDALFESTKLKINSISKSLYNRLNSEYVSIDMDSKSLQEKIDEFNKHFEKVKYYVSIYSASLEREASDIMVEISNDIENIKPVLIDQIYSNASSLTSKMPKKQNVLDYTNLIIEKCVMDVLSKWWKDEDRKIQDMIGKIEEKYAFLVNDMNKKLNEISFQVFKFNLKPIFPKYPLKLKTNFYFKVDAFKENTLTSSLSSFLPRKILLSKIKKELRNSIIEQVEKNLGRIHYDYSQKIENGKNKFKKALLEGMENTKKEIEIGLRKGKSLANKTISEKTKIKSQLKKKLSILSEIINETEK